MIRFEDLRPIKGAFRTMTQVWGVLKVCAFRQTRKTLAGDREFYFLPSKRILVLTTADAQPEQGSVLASFPLVRLHSGIDNVGTKYEALGSRGRISDVPLTSIRVREEDGLRRLFESSNSNSFIEFGITREAFEGCPLLLQASGIEASERKVCFEIGGVTVKEICEQCGITFPPDQAVTWEGGQQKLPGGRLLEGNVTAIVL